METVINEHLMDPILSYLYDRVLVSAIPLYLAHVNVDDIAFKFDVSNFENHPSLKSVIAMIQKDPDNSPSAFLYPSDGKFICSDDEIIVLAYRALNIKSMTAYILGSPEGTSAKLIADAATIEQARRVILGSFA